MRVSDLTSLRLRGLLDALTFPMVVAVTRWFTIASIFLLPGNAAIPRSLHWALIAYGAVTTLFAAAFWQRSHLSTRLPATHPLVLPFLIAIDLAYAALATKLYGPTPLVMIPAIEAAALPLLPGIALLVFMDALFAAIASHADRSGALGFAFGIVALTWCPALVSAYLMHGRRRAERQVRAIDQVLHAGSELGAQLSLADVVVQLLNLLRQFRRVVAWDTCAIYVVQYDETAEEEMLVAVEVSGVDASHYRGKKIAFGTGVVGYAAAKQRAALISDLHKDPRQPDGNLLCGARGSLVVPVVADGQTVGCVQLVSMHTGAYSADQLGLVSRLVSLASVGVRNALLHTRTRAMADTDSLTGLLTTRAYHERLELEFRRTQAARNSLSLLIIDLDNFKGINDTYGHPAGDEVLRRLGALLRDQARREDVCCRYGGDEFIIVMPGTIKSEAAVVANRIRKMVEEMAFAFEKASVRITISIGAASYPQDVTSKQALVKAADDALYSAKQNGRNALRIFSATFR